MASLCKLHHFNQVLSISSCFLYLKASISGEKLLTIILMSIGDVYQERKRPKVLKYHTFRPVMITNIWNKNTEEILTSYEEVVDGDHEVII